MSGQYISKTSLEYICCLLRSFFLAHRTPRLPYSKGAIPWTHMLMSTRVAVLLPIYTRRCYLLRHRCLLSFLWLLLYIARQEPKRNCMATDDDDDDLVRAAEQAEEEREREAEREAERQALALEDPQHLGEVPELTATVLPHPALAFVIKSEWRLIRTYARRISRNMLQLNLRWANPTGPRLRRFLQRAFDRLRRPFYIVAMAGFYLAYSDTEAGLFYAEENTQIFADPSKLRSQADLERYLAEWPSSRSIIRDFKQYFDTRVKVLGIANVLFLAVAPTRRPLLRAEPR